MQNYPGLVIFMTFCQGKGGLILQRSRAHKGHTAIANNMNAVH